MMSIKPERYAEITLSGIKCTLDNQRCPENGNCPICEKAIHIAKIVNQRPRSHIESETGLTTEGKITHEGYGKILKDCEDMKQRISDTLPALKGEGHPDGDATKEK